MTIPGSVETAAFENKNLYNSNELMDEQNLSVYDYGARNYDPQLGKWWQVDPVHEFNSPYVYCTNNPICAVDEDGAILTWVINLYGQTLLYDDGKYLGQVILGYNFALPGSNYFPDYLIKNNSGTYYRFSDVFLYDENVDRLLNVWDVICVAASICSAKNPKWAFLGTATDVASTIYSFKQDDGVGGLLGAAAIFTDFTKHPIANVSINFTSALRNFHKRVTDNNAYNAISSIQFSFNLKRVEYCPIMINGDFIDIVPYKGVE